MQTIAGDISYSHKIQKTVNCRELRRRAAQWQHLLNSVDCYSGHDKSSHTRSTETNQSSYTTD